MTNKITKYFIVFVLFLICIGIVSAETDNFTLSVNQIKSSVSSYTGQSSGQGGSNLVLGMNFDTLKNPKAFVYQFIGGPSTGSTGVIVGTYSGQIIFTGTYTYVNGTYGGGNTGQFDIAFANYSSHGFTGTQSVAITTTPNFGNSLTAYAGYTLVSGVSAPIVVTNEYAAGSITPGNYITNDYLTGWTIFGLDDNSGSNIVTTTITKNDGVNYYATQVKAFSGNSLVYSDVTTSSYNEVVKIPNKPLIFQTTLFGLIINSSVYFGQTNSYSMAVSPVSPSLNQAITPSIISSINGTLIGTALNELNEITITDSSVSSGNVIPSLQMGNGEYSLGKFANNNTWFYTNTSSATPSISLANGLPSFSLNTVGIHHLTTVLATNSAAYFIKTDVNVTNPNNIPSLNLVITPVDTNTMGSISGASYDILLPSGSWSNITELTASSYTLPITYSSTYTIVVVAQNYQTFTKTLTINSFNGFQSTDTGNVQFIAQMIPSNQNLGINNVSLTVNTINSQSLAGLVGTSVTVNGQTQLSSLFGTAIFTVPTNTTYSVKGSLSGFVPSSQTVVVGSSNAVVTLYMAPVVTTTVTIPVTTTTINTTGNYNAIVGSNTKGVTCNPNYATTGNLSNLVGLLQNDAACAGVQTQQNQNGLIAMGICIVLVLIGAEKGKGLGAIVGAIIGYVAALLMGLIPMWSLFAFCILAGLVFAAKIVLSQGDT